jgi:cellulose synthase/poly-beta-1,6-N-acetylglucosamine synthase-like glycosyltransferase
VFADGSSSDRTCALLSAALRPGERIRISEGSPPGKTLQLNRVLPDLGADVVVVTDADARLPPHALRTLVSELHADPRVRVVGACSRPVGGLTLEHYYWTAQNKARLLETGAGTSFIVVAPCYAFSASLLDHFPEDVIADDIYVAFLANSLGYRTVYSRHVEVLETRAPRTYADFLGHKFRKSNAFLRECLRFLHRLPELDPFWRTMLITHTAQQLLLPGAFLLWLLLGITLALSGAIELLAAGGASLGVLLVVTSAVFSRIDHPGGSPRFSLWTMIQGYLLTVAVMLASGITYPFYRHRYVRAGDSARSHAGTR